MGTFLLVDGLNLLFQMYFGMPARIVNKDGKAIQGTLGFVGALLKMLRMVSPTHVVVLFDGEHEYARSAVDASYKANRAEDARMTETDTPFSQLADVVAALDMLGLRHAEIAECETDDVVASYALTYGRETNIVIASFDSDFFQLVTDRVSVMRYRGMNTAFWGIDAVRERCGIDPAQYADFKALTGDVSDNIKGAPHIGSKTAARLLREYGTLEQLITGADEIKKPSVRLSVTENAERLMRNYTLIKLDDTAPIPFRLEELAYHDKGMTTSEVLRAIGLR